MRLVGVICIMIVLAGSAGARPVTVRSGEHGYFSRIVVELGPGDDWSFGRSGKDYVLTFATPDLTADTGQVFNQIPRTRLTDVAPRADGPGLRLSVATGVHAVAFRAGGGQAVIDILDGPPPKESPFEAQIVTAPKEKRPARPLPRPHQTVPPAVPGIDGATLAYRPETNSAASLPVYWRDILPGGVPAEAQTSVGTTDTVAAATAPDLATPLPEAEAAATLPLAPEPEPPVLPALPDPDVLAIENALRLQIARAASQGLADVAGDGRAEAGIAAVLEHGQEKTPKVADDAEVVADKGDTPEVPFHAETAMDRDGRDNPMVRHVTDLGDECLPGELFDVAAWGVPGEPPVRQITAARTGLSGEFDRSDPVAAEKLARLYLHFGMGAEASQVARAFGLTGPDAQAIHELGLVMEGQLLPDGGALRDYAECDTPVALWAFLGAPNEPPLKNANVSAITRAFSGLPAALRRQLGPTLSERLIGIGALDEARGVRNAVARKPEGDRRGLAMMDAELALAKGARTEAIADLDALAEGTDAVSSQALVMAIQTRLAAGEAVDPAQAEAMAALAFERRNGSEAAQLAHLDLLAQARSGGLHEAFRRYRGWSSERPDLDHRATAQGLFAALAATGSDETFLSTFFHEHDILAAAEPGDDLRLVLAARLAQLGFTTEVRGLLTGQPGATERGRLTLARAAVNAFDGAEALRLTEGLETAEAMTLRAAAFQLQGDHLAAATAFAGLGATADRARAAWMGGDIRQAASGRPELAAVIDRLGLERPAKDPTEGGRQTLSESSALLQDSADFRAAIGELLAGDVVLSVSDTASVPADGAETTLPQN